MKPIRVVIYGLGVVGLKQVQPLIEKGAEIVGAIDISPDLVGKDVASLAGLDKPLRIIVSDDAEAVLKANPADVVLLSLFTEIEKMAPFVKQCIGYGLNIVTPSDELNYPWNLAPELSAELDALAKAKGVTIAGSGLGDAFMINTVAGLAAACRELDSIQVETSSALNHVGTEDLERMGIGQDFTTVAEGLQQVGDMTGKRTNLEALAVALGLTVISLKGSTIPLAADELVRSDKHQMVVEKGQVIGVLSELTAKTEEGVDIVGRIRFSLKKESDKNTGYNMQLGIKGDLEIKTQLDNIVPTLPVSNQLVNRIPDVINAPAGLLTVDQLPRPKFRSKPLHCYLSE